jgi:hypothetical protein
MPDEKPSSEEMPPPEPLSGDPQGEAGAPPLGFVADVVRKAVLTGVGALFLTEEGARKLAREWKLPKELASYLVGQAAGAKDEILRVVGNEMRRFLESEAFRREIERILGSVAIQVNAEIQLKPSSPRARPGIKASVRPRFRKASPEGEEEDR